MVCANIIIPEKTLIPQYIKKSCRNIIAPARFLNHFNLELPQIPVFQIGLDGDLPLQQKNCNGRKHKQQDQRAQRDMIAGAGIGRILRLYRFSGRSCLRNEVAAAGIARQGVAMAISVVMMIVPILVFVLNQSQIIETMGSSGMKD